MKTVGIIGGLGPDTTCKFYLRVLNLCRKHDDIQYPPILIYSVSFPYALEREIIERNTNERKMLPVLLEAVRRLEVSAADFIVLPCNTLHLFIDELRNTVSTPLLSILDVTADECVRREVRRVGILATTATVERRLYEGPLRARGIEMLKPIAADQAEVARAICETLDGHKPEANRRTLSDVIRHLRDDGAEAVILGCTDLQLLLAGSQSSPLLIDTVEVLAQATAREILAPADAELDTSPRPL
jgi:aspartate racemase